MPRRLPNSAAAVLLAACLFACSGQTLADIYGFVDESGMVHLSDAPRDPRYYLFKKEPRPGADDFVAGAPVLTPQRTNYVNLAQRKQYTPLVSAVAKEFQLEPALLHALITVESGYNPKARSPKGAIGLTQLMPGTAQRYKVTNIWDAGENLRGGARYLRDLLAIFDNNVSLALAAYNAGEDAVTQYGNTIPPYAETRNYVPRVLQQYRLLNNSGK
jgi:soluble lytic murein transglycosylase-like protein